MIIFFAVCRL